MYSSDRYQIIVWQVPHVHPRTGSEVSVQLGTGWVGPAQEDNGIPLRATSAGATVLIDAPRKEIGDLSFDAMAYFKPWTLQVVVNGKPVFTTNFTNTFLLQHIDVGTVVLHPGRNTIEIRSIQGCTSAHAIIPSNQDARCLAFGIEHLRVPGTPAA
jgi:hypothetical protein